MNRMNWGTGIKQIWSMQVLWWVNYTSISDIYTHKINHRFIIINIYISFIKFKFQMSWLHILEILLPWVTFVHSFFYFQVCDVLDYHCFSSKMGAGESYIVYNTKLCVCLNRRLFAPVWPLTYRLLSNSDLFSRYV